MGLYIIAGVLLIGTAILFFISISKCAHFKEWTIEIVAALTGLMIFGSIMTLLAGILGQIGNSSFIESYQKTLNYVESYDSESEIEQAAVLNKKIEINAKLFKLQYWAEKTPFFVMYSDEIMELEPIK